MLFRRRDLAVGTQATRDREVGGSDDAETEVQDAGRNVEGRTYALATGRDLAIVPVEIAGNGIGVPEAVRRTRAAPRAVIGKGRRCRSALLSLPRRKMPTD